MEINHKQLEKLLERGFRTKVPIDIKGKPGIGKSEIVEAQAKTFAKESGRNYVHWNRLPEAKKEEVVDKIGKYFVFADLRLSQFDQTDLKGFPNAEEAYSKWVPTMLFKALSHPDAQGLVFFDEMNLANPSVVASCYQIVNDHLIGETPISYGVYFVSAGNGVDDTNNAFDDPAPLNNRRINCYLLPPIVFDESGNGNDWTTWAASNGVDARIISFLNWKKEESLFKYDPESKDPAFPSPRMWYKASKLIEGEEDLKTIQLMVGTCVGESTALEFVAFTKLNQKIDVKSILNKPELIQKYLNDIDILHSVVGQVAQMYRKDIQILDKALALCCKDRLPAEYGMYMLRVIKSYSIADKKPDFASQVLACKNFDKVYGEIKKYLN